MAWAESPSALGQTPLKGWAVSPSPPANVVPGWKIPNFALFSGLGVLSATVFAKAQVAAQYSGSGQLAAGVMPRYNYAVALSSDGQLSASLSPVVPASFSGSGALSAILAANAI